MTIHNPELYVEGIWDWGFLDGCFDNGIRVTDIDGFVERNGQFLMIETKRVGARIPYGQQLLFDQFVKKGNCVLVIWGRQDDPPYKVRWMSPEAIRNYPTVDENFLQAIVKHWYRYADRKEPA